MCVLFTTILPDKKQAVFVELFEDESEALHGQFRADGRHLAGDRAEVHFKAAVRVCQAVKPDVFHAHRFFAGAELVRGPHGLEIDHALRHVPAFEWGAKFLDWETGNSANPLH